MKEANYGPVYAALYPELAGVTRAFGYALAIHGSLARDFDLVAVPWVTKPTTPQRVIDEITRSFDIHQIGKPTIKEHGRIAYSVSIGHGTCALDFSFMPLKGSKPQPEDGGSSDRSEEKRSDWVMKDCPYIIDKIIELVDEDTMPFGRLNTKPSAEELYCSLQSLKKNFLRFVSGSRRRQTPPRVS